MNHKDLDAMRKRFEDAGIVAPKDDADLADENAALRAEVERLQRKSLAYHTALQYALDIAQPLPEPPAKEEE